MIYNDDEEYLIYAYPAYSPQFFGRNRWQYVTKNTDARLSMEEAKRLYDSRQYERVEIKKKIFNLKTQRYSLSNYEILGKGKKINFFKLFVVALMVFAFVGQLYISNIISF